MFPNLYSTSFRPKRYRPDGQGFWSGHLPFAADLMDALKPSTLVELGTYYGESYFGFCQAVQERGIDCRTYAVDNWIGDVHTGEYGPSAFEGVSAHNAAHYASFSSLLQMNFDEAAAQFQDLTIDVLHLDGCHTYAAVKHDFETWLPKVSIGGVILIHDIAVQKGDFGVWRFWDEISQRFPSFAFLHSSGLGVLSKTTDCQLTNPFLAELLSGGDNAAAIRNYYSSCAERLDHIPRAGRDGVCRFQVYSPDTTGYSEGRSAAADVATETSATLALDLPIPPSGPLRLDPVNCPAVAEISEIVVERSTGEILWRLDPAHLNDVVCTGTSLRVPDESRLIILSYGDDPQVYLPSFEIPPGAGTLRLRCCIKIDPGFSALGQSLAKCSGTLAEIPQLRSSVESLTAEQGRLQAALDSAASEQAAMRESISWKITSPLRRLGSFLAFEKARR